MNSSRKEKKINQNKIILLAWDFKKVESKVATTMLTRNLLIMVSWWIWNSSVDT